MVKKTIKKMKGYIPTRDYVENHKWLKFLTRHLEGKPYLWEFNQSTVTRATLFGVFWAMLPMPFQMVPAALLAIIFRGNILVAIAWVWVSNPITMIPILYSAYYLGCYITGQEFSAALINVDFSNLIHHGKLIFIPLILGSIVLGMILAIIAAILVWLIYQFYLNKKLRG